MGTGVPGDSGAVLSAEERLRLTLAAMDAHEWSADLRSGIVTLSPGCAKLFNTDVTQFTWQELSDNAQAPVAASEFERELREAVAGGADLHLVSRLADGDEERWVETHGRVRRDDSGRAQHLFGVARDVTRQKRAELELQERQARLDAVLDALPVGVIIADATGAIVRDNVANRELWGVPPDTRSVADYGDWVGFNPKTGKRLEAHEWAMARALQTGEVVRDELVENERFDNCERRWFLNNAAPVRGSDGEIIGGVVAQLDVTERLAQEGELRESEERFRQLAEAIHEVFYVHELAEARISYVSPAYAEIWGRPVEELYQNMMSFVDVVHPADRARLYEAIEQQRDGRSTVADYRLLRDDGTERQIHDRAFVTRHPRTGEYRVVGVAADVTDQRQAVERETLLAREVDHRAKNLLAVVQSVVQLTKGEDVPTYRAAIVDRIQAMARTHTLLASTRWDGLDLGALVEDELRAYGLGDLRITLDGPPLQLSPALAQALAMVLHELATNAVKYGSLSVRDGTLRVAWQAVATAEGRRLLLDWSEGAGPAVKPPERRGFGSRVIKGTVEIQLRGRAELRFEPEGFQFRLDMPL